MADGAAALHDAMGAEVAGTRGALLGLVTKTTLLTVATLGVYSFWARTRVRRWLWSALRIGGTPFEYAGQPLEKLMGFVIAAVIVGIYLGLVVMLLIFGSLSLFQDPGAGFAGAFALVLPVYWFAQYRGLRYLLNHTRWRGVAFSMEPGAWRFAGLTIWWTALSVLTLGLLWPVRTQRMWRYRAERSFYGDDRFRLTLPARRLMAPFAPVLAGLWGSGAVTYVVGGMGEVDYVPLYLVTVPLLLIGWIHWRVASFRRLASSLAYGRAAGLAVAPRTSAVIGIHLGGWFAVMAVLAVAGVALAVSLGAVAASALPDLAALEAVDPGWLIAGALLFYLVFFLGRGALRLAFVTYPLIRHVGGSLVVTGASEVNGVHRGAAVHMADADGFANLFDMGSSL